MRPRSLALVLLLLPLGSCWLIDGDDEGGGGPPCEDDIAGCSDDTSMFMEDPTCTLTGELELELGEGEAEFSSLAAGQLPQLYTGIQGGQHVWMAVRVKNPDLDRKQLAIRIKAEYCSSNCEDVAGRSATCASWSPTRPRWCSRPKDGSSRPECWSRCSAGSTRPTSAWRYW